MIHDFGTLTTELGRRDTDIERFVTGSNAALGNFAHQQQALQESLVEFPATLTAAQAGLASSNDALAGLAAGADRPDPAGRSARPGVQGQRALLRPDDGPDPRPDPALHPPGAAGAGPHQAGLGPDLNKTVAGFGHSLGGLNSFFNELAYKPSGSKQSYLFYLPWLNHDINATFTLQDAGGPVQRGLIMYTCSGAQLATGLSREKSYINALLNTANLPRTDQLPLVPATKENPGVECGPGT